jgi:UPF0755 protein
MRVLRRLFVSLVVVIFLAAALGLWCRQRLTTPYRAFLEDEVFVELPPGTSVSSIADRLAAAGVIPDRWTFRISARLTGADRRLQAGEYRFAGDTSPNDVIARLAAGDVYKHPVTFPEGLTVAEMGEIFAHSGLGTSRAFVQAAADPSLTSLVAAWDADARTLEGFLFPATYSLPRKTGVDGTIRAMVAGFDHAFDSELRAAAAARGMTPHDMVTLASIIEKETARAEERPIVSAVYHNRLRSGMPLQCDPTVIYALMRAGHWDGNLRRVDLEMTSPYNTYRVKGLPPGPIASPGRASMDAAVHPADVPYLYFVSRNDGTHVFARTLAEHNQNVARYQGRHSQSQK